MSRFNVVQADIAQKREIAARQAEARRVKIASRKATQVERQEAAVAEEASRAASREAHQPSAVMLRAGRDLMPRGKMVRLATSKERSLPFNTVGVAHGTSGLVEGE